jgi:hypothetical protein
VQLGTLEVRATQVGLTEVGVVKFGTLEVAAAKVRLPEIGVVHFGALKVCAAQVLPGKVSPVVRDARTRGVVLHDACLCPSAEGCRVLRAKARGRHDNSKPYYCKGGEGSRAHGESPDSWCVQWEANANLVAKRRHRTGRTRPGFGSASC